MLRMRENTGGRRYVIEFYLVYLVAGEMRGGEVGGELGWVWVSIWRRKRKRKGKEGITLHLVIYPCCFVLHTVPSNEVESVLFYSTLLFGITVVFFFENARLRV